jgi:hypothetical protein
MELQEISQLLDRYWEGKLSEEEENTLRKALLKEEPTLEGELKDAALWFKSTASFKDTLQLPEDFDEKVMARIEKQSIRSDSWSWWKIAAAVLIIMTLGYTAVVIPGQKQAALANKNTQEDPLMAYEETKATLALMASMMNNGKSQLESLELFKKAQDKIKNNFESDKNKKDKNS